MIDDTPRNAGGDVQMRRTFRSEASPDRAADTSTRGGGLDADEAYPGELMLVGDPRPQKE